MFPASSSSSFSQGDAPCAVCGDRSSGSHFGGVSCESCKAFFRRSVQQNRYESYKCPYENSCGVDILSRKICQYCRFNKCLTGGMQKKWVLTDEERIQKYSTRRKRSKRDSETSLQRREAFVTPAEKQLIEELAMAAFRTRRQTAMPPIMTEAPTSADLANFLIIPVKRVIMFTKFLREFRTLCPTDQVSLLKGGCLEILIGMSPSTYDQSSASIKNYVSRDQAIGAQNIVVQMKWLSASWGPESYHRTMRFIEQMNEMDLDEVTYILLLPVILFSCDRVGLQAKQEVVDFQTKYALLLQKYMDWKYGEDNARRLFPKLLMKLWDLRELSEMHAGIMLQVDPEKLHPLIAELQDIATSPPPSSQSSLISASPRKRRADDEESNSSDTGEMFRLKPSGIVDDDEMDSFQNYSVTEMFDKFINGMPPSSSTDGYSEDGEQ